MYSAFKLLGTSREKIYIWLVKVEYFNVDNKIIHEGGGAVSVPVVLNFKKTSNNFSISSHKCPEDGKNFNKDVKKLFPSNIKFPEYTEKLNLKQIIKLRAEEDIKKGL